MTLEQQLFEICERHYDSDAESNDFDIDESTDPEVHEKSYNVYHKDGYGFKSIKEVGEDFEGNEVVEYHMIQPWDGFKDITESKAVKLLKL